MKFCTNCGSPLSNGQLFCGTCGSKIEQPTEQRKQVFEGDVHKCPNCGYVLDSFSANCPSCGFELRNTGTSNAIAEFKKSFADATDKEKIALLQGFAIPNNKEDIFEFLCLAEANFDENYYVTHMDEQDLSDAWLATIQKCQTKANLIFTNDRDKKKLSDIVNNVNQRIEKAKNQQNIKRGTGIGLIALSIVSVFAGPALSFSPTLSVLCLLSFILCLVFGIKTLKNINKKK